MNSPTQREALTILAELLALNPDVRLGQLLAHLGFLGEDQLGRNLWEIDDEQLLSILYSHRDELTSRQSASPLAVAPGTAGLATGSNLMPPAPPGSK